MRLQHLIKALVAVRRLIDTRAAQLHVCFYDLPVHHLARDPSRTLHVAGLTIDSARRLAAPHRTSGTVNGAVKSQFRLFTLPAFENDSRLRHRPADKSLLPGKRRSRALTDHPIRFAVVFFAPCKAVVIVDALHNRPSQQVRHAIAHPVASGVGIFPSKCPRADASLAQVTRRRKYARLNLHAILRACRI